MHTITLTDEQLVTIIGALQAVAPTGGGSTQFHLANYLRRLTGVNVSDQYVGMLQTIAHGEYVDAYS